MFAFLDVGHTITVTWTGGGAQKWKSKYTVTNKSGSVITLSETKLPYPVANIIQTGAGRTNFCQGSTSKVTVNGFWSNWEIITNGQVTSSGSDFIVTSINVTQVPLCSYNF